MDSPTVFCPHTECPASGQVEQGTMRVHGKARPRFTCDVCGKTFRARAGTRFFRRRTDEATITRIITLVSHGCPIAAVEAAFDREAQTVRAWIAAAGSHSQSLHQALIVQARDLHQVQADAVRVKTQAGVLGMAMAMMVSTRVWLGGAVRERRDRHLIARLLALVGACARKAPLLFVTDGLVTYVDAVRKAFRSRQRGGRGRPRLIAWPNIVIAQVVKHDAHRAVTGVPHRLIQGSVQLFLTLRWTTPGCQVLNTASIERLNATFRSRLACLGRRSRCTARRAASVAAGMYVVGTVYNLWSVHGRVGLADGGEQTPAMAAGITAHVWSVSALLHYRVPSPRWQPPRQRGRRSKALQALIDRWCPLHR